MVEIVTIEGLEYTASNCRMRYNPEFHFNQGKDWSIKDVMYLCGMHNKIQLRNIALALGRTENACFRMINDAKRKDMYNTYKDMYNKLNY